MSPVQFNSIVDIVHTFESIVSLEDNNRRDSFREVSTWHESLPASPPAQIWPPSMGPMEVAHWAEVTTGTPTSSSFDEDAPPEEVVPQPYTYAVLPSDGQFRHRCTSFSQYSEKALVFSMEGPSLKNV